MNVAVREYVCQEVYILSCYFSPLTNLKGKKILHRKKSFFNLISEWMIGRGKHFRYYIERGDQLENEINKIKTKHFMNC